MKEAMLYRKAEDKTVDCLLCAQHCRIKPGRRGRCGVRENYDGVLFSLVYGKLIAQHVDPIEKKPLFHYYPGSRSYSIATAGCNFRCVFCQNSDISQSPREYHTIFGRDVPAGDVVKEALRNGCATISYTYTEPTIFLEYALEVSRLAHEQGIHNIFVTNGFMTEEALHEAGPLLGAANVDLKAFTDRFYREQCGGRLDPVLKTIERMKRLGIWVEVTTLIIPGLNDGGEELRELARFLAGIDQDIPWHVSRFHPAYLLTDRPPTPIATLQAARDIGFEAGLRYVYTGNIPGDEGENTFCHRCGHVLIERIGFSISKKSLKDGACTHCGAPLSGVGIR
ncbi:MAG: AmmeMemoRadiSam system radical SAM enzyme [Syntrophobacteraceae bacterium]|nr:AmmeMemoRadiSam system radical SAM enzyme [Syntrophobacteraceae bacterium]